MQKKFYLKPPFPQKGSQAVSLQTAICFIFRVILNLNKFYNFTFLN